MAFTSYCRATTDTDAPGTNDAATISRLIASGQDRRRRPDRTLVSIIAFVDTSHHPVAKGTASLAQITTQQQAVLGGGIQHGVTLRQSYRRVARIAQREAVHRHHSGKRREAELRVRKLRIWLGRLARDIARKIDGDAAARAAFAATLGLVNRLFRQKRSDRCADKLYSLHAAEVECIGKGYTNLR